MKIKKGRLKNFLLRIFTLFLVMLPLILPVHAAAEQADSQNLAPPEVQQLLQDTQQEADAVKSADFSSALSYLTGLFKEKCKTPLRMFSEIAIILLAAAVLHGFREGGLSDSILLSIETVVAVALFLVICQPVLAFSSTINETVEACKNFLIAFVPAFSSLILSAGQPAQAAVFSTFFLGALLLVSQFIASFLTPFMQIFTAFSIAGSVSDIGNLSGVAKGMSKLAKWVLVLFATVFGALLGLQSILSGPADTLALKTGKLLVSSAVPIIGKAATDAVGTVWAGLKVVRGATGLAGIVTIGGMFLPILLECTGYLAALGAAKVIAQFCDNAKAEGLLSRFSECLQIFISVILIYAMMIILAIALMITLGGGG